VFDDSRHQHQNGLRDEGVTDPAAKRNDAITGTVTWIDASDERNRSHPSREWFRQVMKEPTLLDPTYN
jgi:hypothetical protein